MKAGVINEFLHNRETAARLGTSSNGSARAAAFDREPLVRMGNTYMVAGDHTPDELLEGVRRGVWMCTFGEWNIDDRRWNFRFVGRECYLIRGGKVRGMVRRPVLEITTPTFYSHVDAVARDVRFEAATCGKGSPTQGMPVWHGGPTVRLREVRVL
jgi:TldD protein